MSEARRIVIHADVMLGKPVIRGTRITVEQILRRMSEGAAEDDILESHPNLTREDIRAAVAFATEEIGRAKSGGNRPPCP